MVVEKLSFFESAILNFFFQKNKKIFALNLFKLVIVYGIPRMGRNFDDYPGFQLKVTHANCIYEKTIEISYTSNMQGSTLLLLY